MSKIKLILTFAFVFALLTAGCGEMPEPPNDAENKPSGNVVGGPVVIPGTGGKTTEDITLDKSYNAAPGKNGMRLVMITQADGYDTTAITTEEVLGLFPDGKFNIESYTTGFGDGFRNQGFVDVILLYFDKLFEPDEPFKISARIRMKRAGGVSTSKGIHFGAYSNKTSQDEGGNWIDRIPPVAGVPQWGPNQQSKGVGMFFRAEASANFRMYYSCNLNSTTAAMGPMLVELAGLSLTREYIYELSRTAGPNASYRFKLLDSKTYLPVVYRGMGNPPVPTPFQPPDLRLDSTVHPVSPTTAIGLHPSLRYGVYPGICIAASAAEISQIKIWDDADAVYTPTGTSDANPWKDATSSWNYANYRMSGDMDDPTAHVERWDAATAAWVPEPGAKKPIFWTPDTTPAYVPARFIAGPSGSGNPGFNPSMGPLEGESENVFRYAGTYNELVGTYGAIRVTPGRSPTYAEETIFFEFFPVGNNNHPAFGTSKDYGDPAFVQQTSAERNTYSRGLINVNLNAITPGSMAQGWFKIVARDLTLDTPEMINSPDYPLLQTLPEYYFRIDILKPAS